MNHLTAQQLNQQFSVLDWPLFNAVLVQNETVECDITVVSSLCYFDGHFPDQAVLPGVVQIHWVGELARLLFSSQGFQTLKKVKFSNVILPEASLVLLLSQNQKSGDIHFEYKDETQRYSSGVLSFRGSQ